MSFLIFKLLFAAIALALLVVAVLIVRQVVRKRQAGASQPLSELAPELTQAAPPARRKPGLGRKVVEPEPEELEPAPVRRRQLQSFADAERSAAEAEAEAVVLPVAVAELEAEADTATLTEPTPAEFTPAEFTPADPEAVEAPAPPASDYAEEVLGRLEDAFEALQAGDLTLDAYRGLVQAEDAAVEERIAALQDSGDEDALEAALAARDSVLWCLDWAEEQAGAEQS